MEEYPETHQVGSITIEKDIKRSSILADIGIQIASDGRIWVCIDGESVIRFKPLKGNLK